MTNEIEKYKPDMPEAFYLCNTCDENNCKRPNDLFWEPIAGEWICRECWFAEDHPTTDPLFDEEPKGLSLETFLLREKEQDHAAAIKAERARVLRDVEQYILRQDWCPSWRNNREYELMCEVKAALLKAVQQPKEA
jgi:hypothetical protein